MAGQGQILKYFTGIILAVLLTHECVVETLDLPETSTDLEFSYIYGQLHQRIPRSTVSRQCNDISLGSCGCISSIPSDGEMCVPESEIPFTEYLLKIEIESTSISVINEMRRKLQNITFPLQLEVVEVSDMDITTVCQPNVTKYQCKCEDGYAWSYKNCKTYEACDDISLGSCGCISGIPSDRAMCVLESELSTREYLLKIEIESASISVINEMRRNLQNITFPLQLEVVEVSDMDITTVCQPNVTKYQCKCEDGYAWSYKNCKTYEACDDISLGSCGCISGIPSDRVMCVLESEIPFTEYLLKIEIESTSISVINEMRRKLQNITFPLQLEVVEVSDMDITTVCQPNVTKYQCKCEDGYAWSYKNCKTYEACDDISLGSCGCISGIPSDRAMCVLESEIPFTEYLLKIEIESASISVINEMRQKLQNITFPLQLEVVEVSDMDITTVCQPNVTKYQCKCEDGYAWSYKNCKKHEACDDVRFCSCGCISGIPCEGKMCVPERIIGMSMKINQIFDISLTNPKSGTYKDLSKQIASTIDSTYSKSLIGYTPGSTKVSAFWPGSVLVDYTINATSNNLDFAAANKELSSALRAQGIILAEDAFAQSDQKDFTTDQLFPLQKLDLNCIQPDFAKGQIKWIVNDKDAALDSTRYLLSNNNSTLTVKNTSESDSGRYLCIIQHTIIPYIQWQNIVIKSRPKVIVGENSRDFPCDGSSVQLKCSVDVGYNIEWVLGGSVYISGSDSITLNYTTQRGNCTEETFICRLKDLPQLLPYSYSKSSVTVKTSAQHYDCQNGELGLGKTGNEQKGTCGNGMKGTITYRCESHAWTPVQESCVLEDIDKLKSTVESLLVEEIPEFMANLSNTTAKNSVNITHSAATVQAVVDILAVIASLSQSVMINKPVMENFLKTVDIIVSGNVSETWNILNKNGTTENTSIKLLRAIENMSDRLTDVFDIIGMSFQLKRNTIKDSFSISSNLPNSTTEIVVPQVPRETAITIIIFTTLDNVLPTRNTTSNNNTSGKSDLRINGDVVVVKVNTTTLPKMSFMFDITNQSLGNPQCVFWNFDLDAWDSTGCQEKPYISDGNKTGKITCECNHTTSFSVLMSPFSIKHPALAYITYIGVGISIVCLVICLIIEAIVWKYVRKNDTSYLRHVSIVNIAVSLLIANVCFIIGAAISKEQPTPVARCSPVVFSMHFFYLALFFWMLISALLLFYRTVMVLSQMSRAKMMIIAFIVGYGAPLLIAVITVATTAGPQHYVSKQACWLNWDESKALLAFVIPALTIVAINLVVLIVVLRKMLRRGVGAATQPDEKHALVVIARCVAILTPIFGLTWGFGIATMVSREFGVHVVFALLNSLQGLFILVFGTLLDRKVLESLPGKLSLSSSHTNNTSAGSSSTPVFPWMRRGNGKNVSDSSGVMSSDSSKG